MGKNNRRKLTSSKQSQKHKSTGKGSKPSGITKHPQAKSKSDPKSQTSSKSPAQPRKPHSKAQHTQPTLPFSPHERILCIGEGDLSFARSLVEEHHCANVVATVYESEAELREKYPHVGENITAVEDGGGSVRYGVDAVKMKPWVEGKGKAGGGGYGIMDRVFFNFPHVGGKSKDVNRQVRYNQELLVSFFKNAMPSLSPTPGSSIIVTLFEGEPYTLWNIRDLGRHSGLQVEQSFRFQAKAYPGYKHARTLGVVKGKNGEVGGGWKGEERSARSYVFVRKGEAPPPGTGKGKKGDSESEDESSADDMMVEDYDEANVSEGADDEDNQSD